MPTTNDIPFWIDQIAIRSLVDRYTDAVNREDYSALPALFAFDAVWETSGGPIELRFEGRDAVVGALQGMLSSLDFLVQGNSAVVVELAGDRARTRVSLSEIGRDKLGKGINNRGMYFDDLQKEVDGQWRFVRRAFRFRYAEMTPVTGQVFSIEPPAAL
jgi:ketosteroid isomerase-like protein